MANFIFLFFLVYFYFAVDNVFIPLIYFLFLFFFLFVFFFLFFFLKKKDWNILVNMFDVFAFLNFLFFYIAFGKFLILSFLFLSYLFLRFWRGKKIFFVGFLFLDLSLLLLYAYILNSPRILFLVLHDYLDSHKSVNEFSKRNVYYDLFIRNGFILNKNNCKEFIIDEIGLLDSFRKKSFLYCSSFSFEDERKSFSKVFYTDLQEGWFYKEERGE